VLRSKCLVGLILAATLIATLVPFSGMVYAQTKEEAKGFIKTAERAKDKADELMEIMENEGLPIPPATMKRYDEGVGNLTAAEAELEKPEPDLSLAVELAKKAMEAFKEVYEQMHTLLEEKEVTIESEEKEKGEGLLEAMSRALDRIKRIREIVPDNIEEQIEKILHEAEDYLDIEEARELLAEGMVNQTAWRLTQANKLLGLAHSLLKKGGQELKVKRIEGYLNLIEKFYNRLLRLVDRAVEKELPGAGDLKHQLEEHVLPLIFGPEGAKAAFEDGDYEEAIDKLVDARNMLSEIERAIVESRKG